MVHRFRNASWNSIIVLHYTTVTMKSIHIICTSLIYRRLAAIWHFCPNKTVSNNNGPYISIVDPSFLSFTSTLLVSYILELPDWLTNKTQSWSGSISFSTDHWLCIIFMAKRLLRQILFVFVKNSMYRTIQNGPSISIETTSLEDFNFVSALVDGGKYWVWSWLSIATFSRQSYIGERLLSNIIICILREE